MPPVAWGWGWGAGQGRVPCGWASGAIGRGMGGRGVGDRRQGGGGRRGTVALGVRVRVGARPRRWVRRMRGCPQRIILHCIRIASEEGHKRPKNENLVFEQLNDASDFFKESYRYVCSWYLPRL